MAFLEDELVRCCATHWIIDLESFEDNVSKLTNYCYDEKNFKDAAGFLLLTPCRERPER